MFGEFTMKQCDKCKEWKSKNEFGKHKGRKDGLNNWCKLCNKKNANKWYYENKERAIDTCRKWALSHLDKVKEIHRNWRKNNPERDYELRKKANRKYKENNREKVRERSRNWKTSNTEKNLQINRNYRARKNGGTITQQEWQWLKAFYDYTCLCCGKQEPEIKLTLDHIKSLKLGGKNVIQNAQPLCGSCNSSKGAKEIDYRHQKELL